MLLAVRGSAIVVTVGVRQVRMGVVVFVLNIHVAQRLIHLRVVIARPRVGRLTYSLPRMNGRGFVYVHKPGQPSGLRDQV